MEIVYVAVEKFIPPLNYYDWSKLYHINEVISFDCALCPNILVYKDADFSHYTYIENNIFCKDLDWLLQNIDNNTEKQVLALIREPLFDVSNLLANDERFIFYGYDLIEDDTHISALTNCGGFNKAFLPEEISRFGLIPHYTKAKEVQMLLAEEYPYEDHANCSLYAIWRMEHQI